MSGVSPCIEWPRISHSGGYALIRVDGRTVYLHRWIWTVVNGPIPDGMFVCHHCDNPPCWNPDHLFLGTPLDNTTDMINKGRAGFPEPRLPGVLTGSCSKGHPRTAETTTWRRRPNDKHRLEPVCKVCRREKSRSREKV